MAKLVLMSKEGYYGTVTSYNGEFAYVRDEYDGSEIEKLTLKKIEKMGLRFEISND